MGLIENILKISLFWRNYLQFSLKLIMASFMLTYIMLLTNKHSMLKNLVKHGWGHYYQSNKLELMQFLTDVLKLTISDQV